MTVSNDIDLALLLAEAETEILVSSATGTPPPSAYTRWSGTTSA